MSQPTPIITTKSAARPKPKIFNLFRVCFISLLLIAAVEYFKYGTRINYEWFHCTPIKEPQSGSVIKLWARGGPSCDKRGEYKTIVKRITRDYEPNDEHLSFCIIENDNVPPVHYPIHEDKGEPGYVAYVGYDTDSELVQELCADSTIYHM
ncbi:BAH_G0042640.mRNA.1.CDS.1 [Saccharomyces cerevisiae]|nr:Lip1p [Saccharomyces cerevisiae YJM1418]CAD6643271.1 SX2_G0025700.mRNA.1.CDS.1 [Saccharomyces cerevisiae]CAD6645976.1 HLJ1_G0021240.mRNA.1.CDS.1 [Saccharomyces cerevisiae]CAI4678417.1 BAH_G0042640.mRNA.1.CDS.1 [Saccharomyces cerevisiae]CAI4680637.1 BAG_1a_G0042690.mRNA.1.CDS.1 [Saccharomyces cerevisiae]